MYVRCEYIGFIDLKFSHTITSRSVLVLRTQLRLLFQVLSSSERFPTKTFMIFPVRATCHTPPSMLELINLKKFDKNNELLVTLKLHLLLQYLLMMMMMMMLLLLLLYKSSDFRIYVFTSCRLISITESSNYCKKMRHNESKSVWSGLRNMTMKHRRSVPHDES